MDPPIQHPKPKRAHNLPLHEPEGESIERVRFKMPYCGSPNARENMPTQDNVTNTSPTLSEHIEPIYSNTFPSTGVHTTLPKSAPGREPSDLVPADDAPSSPSSSNIAGRTQTSSAKDYNNKPMDTHERQQYITVPNSTAFQAYAATHGIEAKVYVHPNHQLVTHDSQTNDASDNRQEAPDNDYNTCLH
jgi:hypothetical protein